MLEVLDNDSNCYILHMRLRDCVPSVELRRRLYLTNMQALLVQRRLRWFGRVATRTEGELQQHRIARGVGEQEAS